MLGPKMVTRVRRNSFWEREEMWERNIAAERVRREAERRGLFSSLIPQAPPCSRFPFHTPRCSWAGLDGTEDNVRRRHIQRYFTGRTDRDRWVKGEAGMSGLGEEKKGDHGVDRVKLT